MHEKWSRQEEKLLFELFEKKMEWRDIGDYFPGRTPNSCRLHYYKCLDAQNVDKELKEKYARAYNRYVEILSYSPITSS